MSDLAPHCPWTEFEPSTLHWCEAQLCAWIREPANTWSNLAFIGAGLWILYRYRSLATRHVRLLGYFSIVLGFMSGLYHASGTFFGEHLDFSSMFLLSSFFVAANSSRMWNWHLRKFRIVALLLLFVSMALLAQFKQIGIELFATQIWFSVGQEVLMWRRNRSAIRYKGLLTAYSFLLVAYGIWWLDKLKIVCNPDVHFISGHAVWHVLNGCAVVAIASFYSQFETLSYSKKFDGET
jgi:Ceramidase